MVTVDKHDQSVRIPEWISESKVDIREHDTAKNGWRCVKKQAEKYKFLLEMNNIFYVQVQKRKLMLPYVIFILAGYFT